MRAARVGFARSLRHPRSFVFLVATSSLVLAMAWPPSASDAPPASQDPAIARRARAMLDGIVAEYRESLGAGGRIARPRELAEARALVEELHSLLPPLLAARHGADGAADSLDGSAVARDLASLGDALRRDPPATEAEVAVRVGALRAWLGTASRADDDVPRHRPDPTRGAEIYAEHCVPCHGADGAGDGPSAAALAAPPAAFTDPGFMQRETPADFALVIDLGRRVAGMPAWNEVLDTTARWDVVSWLWSLGIAPAELSRGDRLFATYCSTCHGDGQPAASAVGLAPLAWRSDAELADGPFTHPAHPPLRGDAGGLSAADRAALVAALRHRSLGAIAARRAPPPTDESLRSRALARVASGVRASLESYRGGGDDAAGVAGEAYLEFEPLEPGIAAFDRQLVLNAEAAFDRLRSALRSPASLGEVETSVAALLAILDRIPAELAAIGRRRERTRAMVGLALAGAAAVGAWGWCRRRRQTRADLGSPTAKKLRS